MIWATSDWHLGHRNIMKYEPTRPNNCWDLLWQGFEVVQPDDEVWFLGDFSLDGKAFREAQLERFVSMPGRKSWWLGNHDKWLSVEKLTNHGIIATKTWSEPAPRVLVSHYYPGPDFRHPERESPLDTLWKKGYYAFAIHGHAHSNKPARWGPENRFVNVSPEVNEFRFVNITNIVES